MRLHPFAALAIVAGVVVILLGLTWLRAGWKAMKTWPVVSPFEDDDDPERNGHVDADGCSCIAGPCACQQRKE